MKHMDEETRYAIRRGLEAHRSLTEIAKEIGSAGSTVSREIRNHLTVRRTGGGGQPFNDCEERYFCEKRGICDGCFKDAKCRNCSLQCVTRCRSYVKENCPRLEKPPYVCNGCEKRAACTLEKRLYDPSAAQKEYEAVWAESHTGLSYTEEEIRYIDDMVSPLLLKGQSPAHILKNHADELMISESTLYRLLDDGLLRARNVDLPRKVRFRVRKKKRTLKVDKNCRSGRTYADFRSYLEEYPGTAVVQGDSVEGRKGGKVLLTIHFVKTELMLAYLRDRNDSASVTERFEWIRRTLGTENFRKLFPVLLLDNGPEFSNPNRIEYDFRIGKHCTRVFYCDPLQSQQKGSAERNHEFIRQIIPKGRSMDDLCQTDIDRMMDHINSYRRESLGWKCPYDAFAFFYGQEILDRLGLRKIDPDGVILRPSLLKRTVSDNEPDR